MRHHLSATDDGGDGSEPKEIPGSLSPAYGHLDDTTVGTVSTKRRRRELPSPSEAEERKRSNLEKGVYCTCHLHRCRWCAATTRLS